MIFKRLDNEKVDHLMLRQDTYIEKLIWEVWNKNRLTYSRILEMQLEEMLSYFSIPCLLFQI